MDREAVGYLHSKESFSALDGPGLRFVLFLQGCPLRCLYCHNPDSREFFSGTEVTAGEMLDELLRYRSFLRAGGVTLSGGEPLAQATFCAALLEGLREEGIHTAIDTSGGLPLRLTQKAVDLADLILLDIKDIDPQVCRDLTGVDNRHALETLAHCEETGKSVWIRQVLLPGWTLAPARLGRLADYLKDFGCVEKVELLPFHKHGEFKWAELGMDYQLSAVEPPSEEEVEACRDIFRRRGFSVQ